MYRRTALTDKELDEIRADMTLKGVTMRRMNPKGMTRDELFGAFDPEAHDWREGLFSQQYRDFAAMKDDKKKWILLDGPMDTHWVENLNSILDDNKKMSLPNGESIKMSDGMCVLLEADHMRNITLRPCLVAAWSTSIVRKLATPKPSSTSGCEDSHRAWLSTLLTWSVPATS
jgi:hypothetical protein